MDTIARIKKALEFRLKVPYLYSKIDQEFHKDVEQLLKLHEICHQKLIKEGESLINKEK